MTRREDTKRISTQEIRVYLALSRNGWSTSAQLATAAEVSRRTAQTHVRRLAAHGLAERRELSPAYLYRRAQNHPLSDYAQRLLGAAEAVGAAG